MAQQWADHYVEHHLDRSIPLDVDPFSEQRAVSTQSLFDASMQQYQYLLGVNETRTAVRMLHCNDWDDILTIVENAQRVYGHDATWFRKLVRWTGDHAPCLHLWAGLLPTDDNMSILAGGVRLLLMVTEERSKQRQKMLQALHHLTNIVSESGDCLRQFSGDESLRHAARGLYIATLQMVEACVNSLIEENIWRKIKQGLFGSSHARLTVAQKTKQTVETACANCDEMQARFGQHVQSLTRDKIVQTASATRDMAGSLATMSPKVAQVVNTGTETLQVAQEMRDRGLRTEDEIKQKLDNQSAKIETQTEAIMRLRDMMQGMIANSEWFRDFEERQSEETRLKVENYQLGMRSLTPTDSMSENDKKWLLWKAINLNPETCADGLELMMRGDHTLGAAPAQARQIFKQRRVQEFMTSSSSDAIFVEGRMEDSANPRRSAMSLACALWLQDLARSPAATVHYFCGLHNTPLDTTAGGIGIARMLIGQLLGKQAYDLGFFDQEWRMRLDSLDRGALFGLFECLIRQLKAPVLFCVIDGATLFEYNNNWKADTVAVIAELLRVAIDCQLERQTHVKLFITGLGISHQIGPMFKERGLDGLVRLRLQENDANVTVTGLRVEIANNKFGQSPSPDRRLSASGY